MLIDERMFRQFSRSSQGKVRSQILSLKGFYATRSSCRVREADVIEKLDSFISLRCNRPEERGCKKCPELKKRLEMSLLRVSDVSEKCRILFFRQTFFF
jgi:hypothetical protein